MALQINLPYSLTKKSYNHHLVRAPLLLSRTGPRFRIQSQKPTTNTEPTNHSATPKKSAPPGLGFGSPSPVAPAKSSPTKAGPSAVSKKKKQRGKRERASIIRRLPVEKPTFVSQEDQDKAKEQGKNESAFLLAWLGLGGIILVEGIVLAASGGLGESMGLNVVKLAEYREA
ncbi:hypothetical protein GH714_026462 [Hevea brasiliensis]|uniref:Uncharacterized protein n=1 Tax=Hevea brasiliensis TaxID=3981 RepID=A0A6A6MH72_HEVBR|nr:hypothetical protein GH714_026462 [Hevea brasiliensis]